MEPTTVLALGCHPDDIEFMMAGTLLRLKAAGCALHYATVANGSCGSTRHDAATITAIRRRESITASSLLQAAYHESLVNDLEVFHTPELIRKVTALIRRVAPDILLLHSPEDYMEDHMNACRLGVTAAFCRGMPNYPSDPPLPPVMKDITLYHALPYGLTDALRRPVRAELYVEVGAVLEEKERMLACHESQKSWLDESQGLDSYLRTLREMSREMGRMSGRFEYAEGWRRHSHLGYSSREIDPLAKLLAAFCHFPPP